MKASSASGLCARWIVCRALTATRRRRRRRRRRRGRLLVEGVEVLGVLVVLGPPALTLRRLVLEEVAIGAPRARGVPLELETARPQHESEEVRGDGTADGVRLRHRRRGIAAG